MRLHLGAPTELRPGVIAAQRVGPAGPVASWSLCEGEADAPLRRNRTCAFGNLLFTPPSTFTYLDGRYHSGPKPPQLSVFLHNRFANGVTTGARSGMSRWTPAIGSPHAAANVTTVTTTPLFIGGDLHGNPAHNQLDAVYPAYIALLRLRARAALDPAAVAAAAAGPVDRR